MNALPQRFNDLAYGTKTLPNGNRVADGDLMGWVYKLKSIEMETPVAAFFIVAIATSWSLPTSACVPHNCLGEKNYRGPVLFQPDLDRKPKPSVP